MLAQDALLGDRYRLTSRIAIGGMGEVWRAEDMVLNRTVAVKVLKSELTSDPTFLARFRAEARTTAALSHPGIANVFDYGEAVLGGPGGLRTAYLVMEHVEGEPLSAILAREVRLTPPRSLDIVRQAAAALDVAHRTGMVHRDVKPGNLLVRTDGVVKVTDFGIARVTNAVPLTQSGMVVGTAQYFSPEQAEGRSVTAASDVYSLGVVAYECLAGRLPFVADTAVAVALMQIRDAPPPLPGDVPPAVRELIARAMAKDLRHRYGTGGEFAAAVRAVQERPYDDPNTVVPVPLGVSGPHGMPPGPPVAVPMPPGGPAGAPGPLGPGPAIGQPAAGQPAAAMTGQPGPLGPAAPPGPGTGAPHPPGAGPGGQPMVSAAGLTGPSGPVGAHLPGPNPAAAAPGPVAHAGPHTGRPGTAAGGGPGHGGQPPAGPPTGSPPPGTPMGPPAGPHLGPGTAAGGVPLQRAAGSVPPPPYPGPPAPAYRRPARWPVWAAALVVAALVVAGAITLLEVNGGARPGTPGNPAVSRSANPTPRSVRIIADEYVGQDVDSVVQRLHDLGLRTAVQETTDGDVRPGTVVAVRPTGLVPVGSPITVYATPKGPR